MKRKNFLVNRLTRLLFQLRLQAMMTTWWLLPRVNPRMLKKLPRIKLTWVPYRTMSKLLLMPKELRCEGAEFIDLGCISIKTF
jgi:hypothetical protein